MNRSEVIWIGVDLAQLSQSPGLTPIDVSLYGCLTSVDESRVPETQTSQTEEAGGAHEGLVEDQGSPGEDTKILSSILDVKINLCAAVSPPVVVELFKKYFEAKHHDEHAAHHHEDHVEEEVSVIEVTHTVVQPGTVMVHLEDTGLADTAVVGAGRLGRDALLTHAAHLLQDTVCWRVTRTRGERHDEVKTHVDQEIVTNDNEH